MTESESARAKYGPYNSSHEVYGVLSEDVAELFDIVREKTMEDDDTFHVRDKKARMISELLQIASVANRAADEIMKGEVKWI